MPKRMAQYPTIREYRQYLSMGQLFWRYTLYPLVWDIVQLFWGILEVRAGLPVVSTNRGRGGVLFMGVLIIRSLLSGVNNKAPDFGNSKVMTPNMGPCSVTSLDITLRVQST